MKNLLVSAIVLLMIGCDSFEERITEINTAPYFVLEGDTIVNLSDSLKTTRGNYVFNIEIKDAEENFDTFSAIASQGTITLNGREVNGSVAFNRLTSLRYSPSGSGKSNFSLEVTDKFGESASLDVQITSFSNLLPVAVVEIIDPVIGSQFERLIDASGSFDQDARFGGAIQAYEYTFLGVTVTKDLTDNKPSEQTAIFPSSGTYQVLVRVQDNDGEWSELISIPVQV